MCSVFVRASLTANFRWSKLPPLHPATNIWSGRLGAPTQLALAEIERMRRQLADERAQVVRLRVRIRGA